MASSDDPRPSAGTAKPPALLMVDDDEALCEALAKAFARRGFAVTLAHEQRAALAAAREVQYAVVDLKLPDGTGLALVQRLLQSNPALRIVVLTGFPSIATAIEAVKLGARYYLAKPAGADEILAALHRDAGEVAMPVVGKRLSVERLEWEHIQRVLSEQAGNISAAARALCMHRRTLQRKLGKHPVRE
ncbi:response regulator transcription factor [Caldimonas tepidiphila]|uniref:response regulator transcription factor n=1 Tax=Caldimonas tepidiphila TaxID=2315841 RepID=UPI000E5BA914|nr:response regulator [Caldimonas tepidiphila]